MSFWQQFSDKIVDVTNYVQERVTGDASTAEYYNPCGTDENALDHEADDNYAAPRFESKHVGEARLDRAFDVVSDLTKKYTGLEIPDVWEGWVFLRWFRKWVCESKSENNLKKK